MGDIQSGWIIKGFEWMKETEIHHLGVIKWAVIEENRFYALNIDGRYSCSSTNSKSYSEVSTVH